MADDAFTGFNNGEEVLLGGDLGVLAMAKGDPTAALLRHFLHLLKPSLSQSLQIVNIHPL